jgi:hypothetical protein
MTPQTTTLPAAENASPAAAPAPDVGAAAPAKPGLVLATLIVVAAVANLPLAMANVALPSIGTFFDASQEQLNLVTVYAAAVTAAISASGQSASIPANVTNELTMSFSGAQAVAASYPQYSAQIIEAAKNAFLAGDQSAYIAGIVAVLAGAALVFFIFPKKDNETKLIESYHLQDA